MAALDVRPTRSSLRGGALRRGVNSATRRPSGRLPVAACRARTDTLRSLLRSPGIFAGPCCHDALSAKLIESSGFSFAFMSGFTTAAAAGLPDTGLLSYEEMVRVGRSIHEATASMPIIGDGDTGYGNAVNVKRTVRGYAATGFAGVLIEDQVAPKSCGHVRGKTVVARDEAVARIQAAVDARDEGADILIVARTDARQAISLDEALRRSELFAEVGADVLFIDALESESEMEAFASLRGAAGTRPKMASLLEGGKTPQVPRWKLQGMGFKLVAYPLSLLGVSVTAMQAALQGLQDDQLPASDAMPSFATLQEIVGFPEYFAEADRYAVAPSTDASPAAGDGSQPVATGAPAEGAGGDRGESTDTPPSSAARGAASSASTTGTGSTPISADAVIEPDDSDSGPASAGRAPGPAGTTAYIVRSDSPKRKERIDLTKSSLRIVITDKTNGKTVLETRLPSGWLAPVSQIVPQLAGTDLQELLESMAGRELDIAKPIYSTEAGKDRVDVWIEVE